MEGELAGKPCSSAGQSRGEISHRIEGLEHLKIIKRKSFELKFMVEPACLGGAGLAGKLTPARLHGLEKSDTGVPQSERDNSPAWPMSEVASLGQLPPAPPTPPAPPSSPNSPSTPQPPSSPQLSPALPRPPQALPILAAAAGVFTRCSGPGRPTDQANRCLRGGGPLTGRLPKVSGCF